MPPTATGTWGLGFLTMRETVLCVLSLKGLPIPFPPLTSSPRAQILCWSKRSHSVFQKRKRCWVLYFYWDLRRGQTYHRKCRLFLSIGLQAAPSAGMILIYKKKNNDNFRSLLCLWMADKVVGWVWWGKKNEHPLHPHGDSLSLAQHQTPSKFQLTILPWVLPSSLDTLSGLTESPLLCSKLISFSLSTPIQIHSLSGIPCLQWAAQEASSCCPDADSSQSPWVLPPVPYVRSVTRSYSFYFFAISLHSKIFFKFSSLVTWLLLWQYPNRFDWQVFFA